MVGPNATASTLEYLCSVFEDHGVDLSMMDTYFYEACCNRPVNSTLAGKVGCATERETPTLPAGNALIDFFPPG